LNYEKIWDEVNKKQDLVLTDLLESKDSYTRRAADEIVEYRKKLRESKISNDLVAVLSVSQAHEAGEDASKYGLETMGEPFFDLEDKLKVITDTFTENGVTGDDYWFLMQRQVLKPIGLI